jgi:hypothetical protein
MKDLVVRAAGIARSTGSIRSGAKFSTTRAQGAIDPLLFGEDGIHQFVRQLAQRRRFPPCHPAGSGEVGLFGKFFGLFDHPQTVGNPLKSADRRGYGFELSAECREILDALQEPDPRQGQIAIQFEEFSSASLKLSATDASSSSFAGARASRRCVLQPDSIRRSA